MAGANLPLFAFNRGRVSPLALARAADLERVALSSETMTNWMPRVLGSMMLRPGFEYMGATHSNSAARFLPFVFAIDDTALIECTDFLMRVWVGDTPITRAAVGSTVTNGTFDADISGWTDSDEAGATSAWQTGGYMGLTGTGTNAAIRDQQVTVAVADQSAEHALCIVVERGPATLRVGSSAGDDDYIAETTLQTGKHSLALTPTGDFHVRLQSRENRLVLIDSCEVEASGVMTLSTPWPAAVLGKIRTDQSGDVVFCAAEGYRQQRIERRGVRSWSIVDYVTEDGPFRRLNTSPITLTPSAITGNITVTASAALFSSSHVGALFRIESEGQTVTASLSAENTFTGSIKVTGTDAQRPFAITVTGIASSTVTLQFSTDDATWSDVSGQSYTTAQSKTYDDNLDNQTIYYRIGIKTGDYGSDTCVCTLQYDLGSIAGVVRVTEYTNATLVSAEVLSALGDTGATADWLEGSWSSKRGFPTSTRFHEGRLWWFGQNGIYGSVSDAFDIFNPDTEGDSGPINRTIGSGPVDAIHWGLSLSRLVIGAEGAEHSIKSTSLDEPLTPTTFNRREVGTQGSANVDAIKIDSRGIFVQRGGLRVFALTIASDTYDYEPEDLTQLLPEFGSPGIVRTAVQRQPDTRIHFVRSDGTAGLMVFDIREKVICLLDITSPGAGGEIEDVVTLPAESGDADDRVYYLIKRTIEGSTVRYLEKLALESECQGGTLNKQADSFVSFTNSPASSGVTGLSHLAGESVVVWTDGKCLDDENGDIATFTVTGDGEIARLTDGGSEYTATAGIVGLAYTAPWKSTKLLQIPMDKYNPGPPIGAQKRLSSLATILRNTHHKGLQYGPTFEDLDDLPQVVIGADVDDDTIHSDLEVEVVSVASEWGTDARLCMQANAPRPCTLLGAIAGMEAYR